MIVCVVTRHLLQSRPVPSKIIFPPKDTIFNIEDYFREQAELHITEFTNQFVEFTNAVWYIDMIIDNHTINISRK